MTEILGGSDVRAATQTISILQGGNVYKLYGLKWFTSAIDADITFTLAKIKHEENVDASPTLFFLKMRDKNGKLNNINLIRLKDKMGTRQLPTAELVLEGAVAEIASPVGKGISFIMNLANITRLHNITTSVGFMRRMIALVEDYSHKRKVFGKELADQELHIQSFSEMKFNFEGNFLLMMQLVKMHGKSEYKDYKNKELVRMLLPIAKIFAGRTSEHLCLEGIQCFGGVGYMENSGIPIILRDTIVTSIWEGSINVLSFDFLKVITGKTDLMKTFFGKVTKHLNKLKEDQQKDIITIIKKLQSININIKHARNLAFL
jgi:alkylation response protein AidB-like acyl-CoA dehydrogenase